MTDPAIESIVRYFVQVFKKVAQFLSMAMKLLYFLGDTSEIGLLKF